MYDPEAPCVNNRIVGHVVKDVPLVLLCLEGWRFYRASRTGGEPGLAQQHKWIFNFFIEYGRNVEYGNAYGKYEEEPSEKSLTGHFQRRHRVAYQYICPYKEADNHQQLEAAAHFDAGHHWYFEGQSTFNMAVSSCFSAMEVVPLVLLCLEGWRFRTSI